MASQADKPTATDSVPELTEPPEQQCQKDVEALSATMAVMEGKIAVCDLVLNDLKAIQKLVQDKGLCDAAFGEQNN